MTTPNLRLGLATAGSHRLDASIRRQAVATEPAMLSCLLEALDLHGDGLAILDENACVIYANPIARVSLGRQGWLRDDQSLRCPHAKGRESWLRALRAVFATQTRSLLELDGADPESLPDADDRHPAPAYMVVAPLRLGEDTYALLTLGRPQMCGLIELSLFAKHCHLSVSERQVLRLFCQGEKPAAIAQKSGVALSTIVTHLKAIRAKTGCTDLRDLLHKMARLPRLRPLVLGGNGCQVH